MELCFLKLVIDFFPSPGQKLLFQELSDAKDGDEKIVDRTGKKIHGGEEIESDKEKDDDLRNNSVFHKLPPIAYFVL